MRGLPLFLTIGVNLESGLIGRFNGKGDLPLQEDDEEDARLH
jgi:hypothetical protein